MLNGSDTEYVQTACKVFRFQIYTLFDPRSKYELITRPSKKEIYGDLPSAKQVQFTGPYLCAGKKTILSVFFSFPEDASGSRKLSCPEVIVKNKNIG